MPPTAAVASPPSQTDRAVRGVLIAFVTAGLIGIAGAFVSSKADRRDVDRVEAKVDRILDVICADKPAARACQ